MSEGLRVISSVVANQAGGTLLKLSPDLFIDDEVDVYNFCRDHFRTHRQLPAAATIQSETNVRLPNVPEPLQFYVDSLENRYTFNIVRDRYAEMRQQMATRDMAAVAETVSQMYRATNRNTHDNRVVNLSDGIQMVIDRLDATRGSGGITGIESYLPSMNDITGGYQDSDIISIIGRPGTGKTYELLKEADHAYRICGHSVLVITTEMGIEPLYRRHTSIAMGLDPGSLKHNTISTHQMRRIRSLHQGMIDGHKFKVFSVGMNSKMNAIEGLIQEFGPDIVFIDGAYLLHPSIKGTMKRIERVGEVYDEMKAMNLQAKIPFVATMQFNRQAGKDGKDGSLETIGFSDAVGMHSSLVLALKYGPTEDPKASRTLEFMKGREGETGAIHHHFKFAPLNFNELLPEEHGNAEDNEHRAEVDGWMVNR